jgi:hypothetical protein
LSGIPDEVHEIIYSNLFEVKKLPEKVYIGTAKYKSFDEILEALQKAHPDEKHFPLKFRFYEDKIVTFANLDNPMNLHREIIHIDKILQESVADWLEDQDKEKIIVSLLNKEIIDKASRQGMRYDNGSSKLYYTMFQKQNERKEEWPSRYKGVQKKQVAKRMWSDKLNRYIYTHGAIRTAIMKIDETFYLRLNPTMMITEDGKKPLIGMKEGAIITGQTYRIYNKQQLNNILFWINKLGDGNDVFVIRDFEISCEPVHTSMEIGISWDMPTSDFKQIIEEFDAELEQAKEDAEVDEDDMEDENYDF